MWSAFHRIRVLPEELPKMWKDLFQFLGMQVKDKFLEQCVNQKLFDTIITQQIVDDNAGAEGTSVLTTNQHLTTDELNVLQYVGGFVPHSLLKKFKRYKKHSKFLECLGEMAVASDNESDLFDYTKVWMEKVNRGGLFSLNNITFQLFVSLETIARQILPAYISSPGKSLSDVINSISSDANVQWYWTLASKSINSPEDTEWLLKEIINLFVTVRGFSIAANWMELYKTEAKKTTKKSTGLRKHLS